MYTTGKMNFTGQSLKCPEMGGRYLQTAYPFRSQKVKEGKVDSVLEKEGWIDTAVTDASYDRGSFPCSVLSTIFWTWECWSLRLLDLQLQVIITKGLGYCIIVPFLSAELCLQKRELVILSASTVQPYNFGINCNYLWLTTNHMC